MIGIANRRLRRRTRENPFRIRSVSPLPVSAATDGIRTAPKARGTAISAAVAENAIE